MSDIIMMEYVFGVLIAIASGCFNNFGVLLQKKVINDHLNEPEFLKSLVKNPIWVLGLLFQLVIGGAIFYLIAQILLGPSLVPGLMSAGLIVLALGSTKILKEKLHKEEILGILLMIFGVFTLSLSELLIDMSIFNILEQGFLIRIFTFTAIIIISIILIYFISKRIKKGKGVFYAVESGLIYSLSSIWIAPITTFLTHLFSNSLLFGEILLFIPALILTIIATVYGIIFAQKAFQSGQVNLLSPLIGVPGQLIPVMIYFLVFNLNLANYINGIYLIIGLVTILISTFLLATKQVKLEEITK